MTVARSIGQRFGQEYREQEARARSQQKRAEEVDRLVETFNVLSYLKKCDIDFEGEDPYSCAERIKQAIRPKLIEDPSLNFLNAEQRVKELVDRSIDSTERTPEIED